MTDTNTAPAAETTVPEVKEIQPTRLQRFVINYPRASKVITIVGGVLAIAGVGTVTHTATKNRHHLSSASEHLALAGSDVANAVSPSSDETTD